MVGVKGFYEAIYLPPTSGRGPLTNTHILAIFFLVRIKFKGSNKQQLSKWKERCSKPKIITPSLVYEPAMGNVIKLLLPTNMYLTIVFFYPLVYT